MAKGVGQQAKQALASKQYHHQQQQQQQQRATRDDEATTKQALGRRDRNKHPKSKSTTKPPKKKLPVRESNPGRERERLKCYRYTNEDKNCFMPACLCYCVLVCLGLPACNVVALLMCGGCWWVWLAGCLLMCCVPPA
jgi:hypothetical protein